jgi:hypothetical protein
VDAGFYRLSYTHDNCANGLGLVCSQQKRDSLAFRIDRHLEEATALFPGGSIGVPSCPQCRASRLLASSDAPWPSESMKYDEPPLTWTKDFGGEDCPIRSSGQSQDVA